MRRHLNYLIPALAIFILSQFMAPDLYAQGSEREGKTIIAINVKGNMAISNESILSKIKTKTGDAFSQETLNDDLKRLYSTEYFTNVSIDVEDAGGDGVTVTFIVEEKPVIEAIIFKGNKALTDHKLRPAIKSKPDEMLNLSLLAGDIAEIRNLYIKKGYPTVDVTYAIDAGKETNKAKIIITIDEKSRIKVAEVTITGNKFISTGKIKKILATKPAWLFNQGIFRDDAFQEDLEKIKSLYDDEGYLDVETVPNLKYSEDGKALYINIEIKEGKQYLIGDISIKGVLVLPEKDVRSNIAMKPGKSFSNRALRSDVMAVRQYYYRYGYMNVVIDVDRSLNLTTGKIDIAYNIDAKELVYVGKIDIRGNNKTKEVVVRRELRVYPGERFDGDKIKRSKERLYNLGLFEDISFDTEQTELPDFRDLVVNVKEAKTGEFSFGGGYSSIDFLVGFIEVSQRNFDIMNFPTFTGAGQNLAIKAELGMVRRNYNISWTDPWILGYPYSFGFDAYQAAHKRSTDVGWAYDERRSGGDLRLGKDITDYLRVDTMYRLEEVRIESVSDTASQDLKDETGSKWVSSASLQLTQDTRDNIFNPTKGYVLSGGVQDAGGFLMGDKDFLKGTASASYYHAFFEKFVLEVRGRMGLAGAYGDTKEVPIYERFFAGGANTIRGYKERAVGPRDPGSNDPVGGEALLVGNAELTFPIFEKLLKGAVFYDIGNAWRRKGDFGTGGDYRYGAGVGIRVKTPIGPMRLDYGYPLVANHEDKKQGEFYFSMSHGF